MDVRRISPQVARRYRKLHLWPGKSLEELVYLGDDNPGTGHFGTFLHGALVGVSTLIAEEHKGLGIAHTWRIRGMVAAPAVRGQGFGKALLQGCIDHALNNNACAIWCYSRLESSEFYKSQGFHVLETSSDVPGAGLRELLMLQLHD